MFRLSTKTLIILAGICFLGSVLMQALWIRSAYEGEWSVYNKEKQQFRAALEIRIRENPFMVEKIRELLLTTPANEASISPGRYQPLLDTIGDAIESIARQDNFRVQPKNFGFVKYIHDPESTNHYVPLILHSENHTGEDELRKANRICLHCIAGNDSGNDPSMYQFVLLYGNEKARIYKNIGLLIAGCLSFLFFIGLLFRLLLKRHAQERKLSAAKNDFINNLSHEIQTPVFAVQLANRLIKEKAGDDADIRSLTAIIEKETLQLKQHAGKILELASLENGQVHLHIEVIELNSFIDEKYSTLELMLNSQGGHLTKSYHHTKLYAKGDRVHINNVLISLTENAIKYNDHAPELTIETGEFEKMVYMRLSDNGIGIEQQHLPFVFDKFYRVHGSKNNAKGFGLGLSYVKQIIRLHDGDIAIKSEPGKGTAVTIYLPREQT